MCARLSRLRNVKWSTLNNIAGIYSTFGGRGLNVSNSVCKAIVGLRRWASSHKAAEKAGEQQRTLRLATRGLSHTTFTPMRMRDYHSCHHFYHAGAIALEEYQLEVSVVLPFNNCRSTFTVSIDAVSIIVQACMLQACWLQIIVPLFIM